MLNVQTMEVNWPEILGRRIDYNDNDYGMIMEWPCQMPVSVMSSPAQRPNNPSTQTNLSNLSVRSNPVHSSSGHSRRIHFHGKKIIFWWDI